MDKLKLIYNPFSGDKTFKFDLDACIAILQKGGFEVHIFRTLNPGDIENHIAQMDADYDAVVVSGGDGTVNLVINAMMRRQLKIPIGIIPSGTANDLAAHMGIRGLTSEQCCELIIKKRKFAMDVGVVNGKYFVNVCGGGLLTNVSQNIDIEMKNILGKMAYYIDGIKQLPNFAPVPLRITNSSTVLEESVYLFLIMNGSGAGSFDKLAAKAKINDGMLDFVAVRSKPIMELAILFLKILRGEHLDDSNIIFFQDNYIKIELLTEDKKFAETDIDGEAGPCMPIEVSVAPRALEVFVSK